MAAGDTEELATLHACLHIQDSGLQFNTLDWVWGICFSLLGPDWIFLVVFCRCGQWRYDEKHNLWMDNCVWPTSTSSFCVHNRSKILWLVGHLNPTELCIHLYLRNLVVSVTSNWTIKLAIRVTFGVRLKNVGDHIFGSLYWEQYQIPSFSGPCAVWSTTTYDRISSGSGEQWQRWVWGPFKVDSSPSNLKV